MGDFNSLIKQVIDKTNFAQLKRVTGKIISVESKSRATVRITGTETELSLINKTGEKLSVGDNVHVHYWGNITSGYIAIRNGSVKPLGVGEDLGNGNERFNNYDNNIIKEPENSSYNSIRNYGNTLVKGGNNDIAGSGNRVVGGSNSICGDNNYIFGYGFDNTIGGTNNVIFSSEAFVTGTYNVVGALPTTQVHGIKELCDNYYINTESESSSTLPSFLQWTDDGAKGNEICAGEDNVVCDESITLGHYNIAIDGSYSNGSYCYAVDSSLVFGEECIAYNHSLAGGFNCQAGTQVKWDNIESLGVYSKYQSIKSAGSDSVPCCFAWGNNTMTFARNAGAIGKGLYNREPNSFVCGKYNDISQSGDILFYVGNGSGEGTRSNAFEVHTDGSVHAAGAYQTTGADYAELFQWDPSVPMEERNKTRFLSTKGKFITPAESGDYVVGVISHNYNFLGNQELLKEVDVDDVGTVGLLGQVIVEDDGSCKIDGFCKPSRNGIGTASDGIVEYNLKTNTIQYCYRVIERIDENHVKIILK